MNIREQLASYLQKIGVEDGKVASLFNEDGTELTAEAVNMLLQHDATRVQKFKTDGTTLFNQGHQKGLGEGAQKIEKDIKEKFALHSDKQGIELIDEILAIKTPTLPADNKLDENKVKLHPTFVAMQDELNKKVKETESEWSGKLNEFKDSIQKEVLFNEVVNKAKGIVLGMKPVLPADVTKAERQMQLLINDLKLFDFQRTEDGKDFIISKDGKPLEDAHGIRGNFDGLVKDTANSIWEFQHGQQRSSASNSNDNSNASAQTSWKGKVPTNDNEYMRMIDSAKDGAEKIAITDAYEKSLEGN